MHRNDLRSRGGQASTDYVGVLAVVAAAVALSAAAISPPPLATAIAANLRHAVCVVAGGVCTAREARKAGLTPCVVHVRSDGDSVGAVIAVVTLRRGDTAVVERRSDGTASVSFLDANAIGGQTGIGFSFGRLGGTGTATAAAGVSFNTGRTYEFATFAAARSFLARHAADETTVGEGLDVARRVSPLHAPRRLPAPRSSSYEAGTWAELEADVKVSAPRLGARLTGEGDAGAARLLGRRRRGARTTWYLRIEQSAAARLGAVVGSVGGAAGGEAVLEVTTRDGRPVSATVTGFAAIEAEASLYGHSTDLGALARRLEQAGGGAGGSGGGGMAVQASVDLDLTVPENAAAFDGALDVLRLRVPPPALAARLADLGRRLDADGRVEVAYYRTSASVRERSAELALGAEIGVKHVRSRQTRELVSAWSAHGGALREREDCAAAAAA
ncbi:MAG: hypothetical protein AVDCRST_MAG38-1789 [uncultured Solirubrobacteraceae bacterium]|uniref:Uncharacterized protein n=1 Tax=uncultured Solirubrobacteraceae bacterium TaxID=1162706 RepID=A0A6J4RPL4_9ACTN|nr:MAG: hypothetical protein AVDCRST_MAG38-1789 [uncultured Solirubrobacteraceae bacterium]